MRKRLFNQQSEPRSREAATVQRLSVKARIMMALFALMLIPQGTWAQYDLKIGNQEFSGSGITDLSALSEFAGIITRGSVVYNHNSHTLSLNGATISGSIVWNYQDNLNIELEGDNVLTGRIIANNSYTLTFIKSSASTGNCSLTISSGAVAAATSAISGFSDVWYKGIYLVSSTPISYDGSEMYDYPTYSSPSLVSSISLKSDQVYHRIWVDGAQLVGASISGANLDYSGSSDSDDGGTRTLTLKNYTVNNPIVSDLPNLTILLNGTNKLGDNGGYIKNIRKADVSVPLTIGTVTSGSASTLEIHNTTGNSAVEGFASVTLDGTYLCADNSCTYVGGTIKAYQYPETDTPYPLNVQDLIFTTTHYYPLWVGSQQVSEANNGIINFLGIGTASFEHSTSGENTLTLEGVSIDSSNGIESGLDNLTIALKGVNSINTNTAYHYYPIYSNVANASLTIKKDETATDCSLTLSSSSNSPQVVKGFKTVTYDGLAYDTTVGSGTTLDAIDTYGAKLSFTTYPLTVAGTPVTSANKGDVLNNGKVSYSHDATNNTYTLKLNGATIAGGVVWSAGDDLTIELTGENSISNTSGHAISGTFTTSTPTVNFIAVGGTSGSSCKLTLTSGLGNYHTINGLNVNTSLSDLGEVDNATNRTRIISSAFDVNKAGSLASIAKATYSPTASLVPTTVTLVIGRTQIDLINGRDFDISDIKLDGNTVYDFNKAGNYLVTIEGKDNYIGTRSNIGYIVEPKSVVGLTVAVSGTYTYTGSAIKPTITVTDGTTDLVADTDYTISSYANNTNAANATDASAPTVTIKGKGNYDNNTTENVTFTISKADFKDVTIDAIDNQTYTGSAIQPAVSVKFNGISVNTSEYNVGYSDNTNVGTATVKATAAGTNFTAGTYKETTFKIDPAAAAITATDQTVIFNGAAQAYNNASGSGTLQVTYYNTAADRTAGTSGFTADPVNASTYYVRVTQNDANYTSSPVDVTFTINPLAATPDVALTIPTSYVYDGTAKTPAVAVSVSGVALTTDDYSVAYTDNINAGRAAAKATVTLKRNYSGSKVETFDINPLTATLSWGNTTFVYNGTAQAPTATVTNLVGTDVCNVTVGGAETAAGSYTATATALSNANYQLPASPTTTFTILDRTATIDFGDRTFKTYYDANETFIVPDGTTAYIVTGVSGNAVTIQKVSYIKAGVPVLLESTPGSTVAKNVSETFTGNLLKYAAAATPATEKHYLLYKNEFVRASGTISNKVYLDLAGYSGGARSLVIGDGATAIEGIVIDEEDGDAKWYDMQGRRINKPTKAGLYIKDGQKVVVKTRY